MSYEHLDHEGYTRRIMELDGESLRGGLHYIHYALKTYGEKVAIGLLNSFVNGANSTGELSQRPEATEQIEGMTYYATDLQKGFVCTLDGIPVWGEKVVHYGWGEGEWLKSLIRPEKNDSLTFRIVFGD